MVVLVRSNADALTLAADADLELDFFEGSNLGAVDLFLNNVLEGEDDPSALLDAILRLLSGTGRWSGTGASALRYELNAAIGASGQEAGQLDHPLVARKVVSALVSDPTFQGAIRSLHLILRNGKSLGWAKHSPNALGVLGSLPEAPLTDQIYDAAYAAQQALAASPMPRRCVSTIHKAKGREFPHAVLADAGVGTFRGTRADRNLFYVAISRPTESLTLVLPKVPSPLIRGLT